MYTVAHVKKYEPPRKAGGKGNGYSEKKVFPVLNSQYLKERKRAFPARITYAGVGHLNFMKSWSHEIFEVSPEGGPVTEIVRFWFQDVLFLFGFMVQSYYRYGFHIVRANRDRYEDDITFKWVCSIVYCELYGHCCWTSKYVYQSLLFCCDSSIFAWVA